MTNEYACPMRSECGMYKQNPDLPSILNPVFRHEVCDGGNDKKNEFYKRCAMYQRLVIKEDDLGLSESFPIDDDMGRDAGLAEVVKGELLGDDF